MSDAPLPHTSAMLASFLRLLRSRMGAGGVTALPDEIEPVVRQVNENDDLPARFEKAANAAGATVHRTDSDDWPTTVSAVLKTDAEHWQQAARGTHEATPATHGVVCVQPEPCGALSGPNAERLAAALRAADFDTRDRTDDETLFAVDAAVTGVIAAVAETGTVVCQSGPDTARGTSLIPPVHVAMVAESQILPDLYDYFARVDHDDLPANVNLITGPSKTADIEGTLVTGVHGPGRVHIVLIAGL